MDRLDKYAKLLDEAARTAQAVPQISTTDAAFTPEEAYEVQARSVARRYQRGERRIGVKMGLTSRAKMIQVGVDEVAWGRLTDSMLLEEGAGMSHQLYVHPRIEPEIVFLLKRRLEGKVTALEALNAVRSDRTSHGSD